jgi:hypothetical protein
MSDNTKDRDDDRTVLWTNTIAKQTIRVDLTRPCTQCQGGEYWECGRCLGSGWEPATVRLK